MIKMKKVLKIGIILSMILIMFMQLNMVYADSINPNEYDPSSHIENETLFVDKVKVVLGIIRAVGIVVSVIALMIIGIKNMTGSIEEKSQYKQALPAYIIGAIMVMAMTALPSVIYDVVTKSNL